jgi:hypothetical protein
MASWYEFCNLARNFGGKQLNDNGWLFEVQGHTDDRTQKVFVFREVMQPDFEFIQLTSAFALIRTVDCEKVLKAFGRLNAGAIGYSSLSDANGNETDGVLNLTTSIPLAALDLSNPGIFFLYLNIFGQAADNIEDQVSALPGSPNLF